MSVTSWCATSIRKLKLLLNHACIFYVLCFMLCAVTWSVVRISDWLFVHLCVYVHQAAHLHLITGKGKASPYSITERRVPEMIPVLGCQPATGVSHKPGGRLPLLSARPAVSTATLKRAATTFDARWTEAGWVWTVCLRLLPHSVAAAIWTRALLRLSPAR